MYKLLIADDEVIEREAVKFIVSNNFNQELEVFEAVNGKDMFEKASKIKPDIVLTDIKMPGMSGLEAGHSIRQILPECRIILMSAFHYFSYAKEALTLGADEYITKPVPADVLAETIRKTMKNISDSRARKKFEEETNNKLKNIAQYLEEELITLMSSGEIKEKSALEFFNMMGIQSSIFTPVMISLAQKDLQEETGGQLHRKILKRRALDKIKEKVIQKGKRCIAGTSGDIILLLLLDDVDDEFDARKKWLNIFTEIKDEIYREIYIDLSIGIGNQCRIVEKIYHSFLQAKISLKYSSEAGIVINYGDMFLVDKVNTYPLNKEKRLVESFLQGDQEKALDLIDELFGWLSTNIEDTGRIRQKMYEILLILMREAAINLNFAEFDYCSDEIKDNMHMLDTLGEISAFTRDYICRKIMIVRNARESHTSAFLNMIYKYIDANYTGDLSVESVAEAVKVSPSYLSRLFKKEAGMNFIDYLTEYRMKKAKELLLTPTNNVREVCFMVGYKDPNYFSRAFKRIYGMTPTEFREY